MFLKEQWKKKNTELGYWNIAFIIKLTLYKKKRISGEDSVW